MQMKVLYIDIYSLDLGGKYLKINGYTILGYINYL